jgi:hypothetical protein
MLVGSFCAEAFAQEPSGSVTLQWTAPGDDSLTGTATRYDIRFSLFPINELNFVYCTGPGGIPRPGSPGTLQRFTVFGLLPGLRYYFALKTADERLNWSRISNVVAFAEPAVGVDPDSPPFEFRSPVPNPARASAGFAYSLATAANVQVDVFDVQGRLLRRLANTHMPAGAGLLTWDLRDKFGDRVAVGVYLARAQLGDMVITRRILVAR